MINLFVIILVIDYGIQLVFGILSILLKTDKFYDIVGSSTFIICTFTGVFYGNKYSEHVEAKIIQALCICVWAGKLGTFLLYRVIKSGGDARFDDAKKKPLKMMLYWMLQGSWVYLNLAPSLFLWTTTDTDGQVEFISVIGWVMYLFGLVFETVADYQKYAWRKKPDNTGRFITSGLWSISRHPNYFGEIVLWFGLFVAAAPYFSSRWSYFSLLCPFSTACLICFISGIPPLEKKGMERWGKEPEYAEYVHSTGVLIPWLVCCECTPLPSTDLLITSDCENADEIGSDDAFESPDTKSPDADGMEDVDLDASNPIV